MTGILSRAMSATKTNVTTRRPKEAGLGVAADIDASVPDEKNRLRNASSKHRNAGTFYQ